MSTPLSPAERARPQLGSPAFSVNSSATYLRHRAAAARAARARQRTAQLQRLVVMVVIAVLYAAIGHELVQLTRAKTSLLATELRSDTQILTTGIRKLVELKRLKEAQTPELLGDAEALSADRAETAPPLPKTLGDDQAW